MTRGGTTSGTWGRREHRPARAQDLLNSATHASRTDGSTVFMPPPAPYGLIRIPEDLHAPVYATLVC